MTTVKTIGHGWVNFYKIHNEVQITAQKKKKEQYPFRFVASQRRVDKIHDDLELLVHINTCEID